MATFWFYANAYAQPNTAASFDDADDEWVDALHEPRIVDDKHLSVAVCGAEFVPGTTSKNQAGDNILRSHGLVLDVDVWREDRPPFTREELEARLPGIRFVAWTTYSSTAALKKWRVVIPLRDPMPPQKYGPLWDQFNVLLDNTMARSTRDPGRLGFVASLGSEAQRDAYQWFVHAGERLDWTELDLDDEELQGFRRALGPADLTRSPDWISDADALARAKRYFRDVGVGVEEGSRHVHLLRVSCRCHWDFALDEAGVREVLTMVNANFEVPKGDEHVEQELRAGWERTLGAHRVDQPTPYGAEREPAARATRTALADHAKTLRKNASDARRNVSKALTSLSKGESYAEPPEARVLALNVADEVARLYPSEKPERLLDLITPGLDAQRNRNANSAYPVPTDQEILSKIRWQQNATNKHREEREMLKRDRVKARIAEATGGARTEPYTAQEIHDWEQAGFNERQWILQHEESFYFRVGTTYAGPFRRGAAANFAPIFLSPAGDRVRLDWHDKNGVIKRRPFDDLVNDYGSMVFRVERVLHGAETTYDPITHKLSLLVSPLRDLPPEFNPFVDEWLRRLAGAKYPLLLEWLARVTFLDRALTALYLVGETHSGKNLLANGLARLWTDTAGATSLEDYLKQPDTAELVPVLLADEGLPQAWDRAASRELRAFTSRGSRMVRQPFLPAYLQLGYPRLVLAANESILATHKESHRKRDTTALAKRVLMLNIDSDPVNGPRAYLESLGMMAQAFVTQDILAKHVLWLRDNHVVTNPNERFGVVDSDQAFTTAWSTTTDKNSSCFEWLHQFLLSEVFAHDMVLAEADGTLWVHPAGVSAYWSMHDSARRGIRDRDVFAAFKALSTGRALISRKGHKDTHYRRVDMEKFIFWLENVMEANLEPVAEAIDKLAKLKPFTTRGYTPDT